MLGNSFIVFIRHESVHSIHYRENRADILKLEEEMREREKMELRNVQEYAKPIETQ